MRVMRPTAYPHHAAALLFALIPVPMAIAMWGCPPASKADASYEVSATTTLPKATEAAPCCDSASGPTATCADPTLPACGDDAMACAWPGSAD